MVEAEVTEVTVPLSVLGTTEVTEEQVDILEMVEWVVLLLWHELLV